MFKKPDKFPHSAWVKVPASSFLITSSVFVVFVLDMASPGYGSFVLITNTRPLIATLTTDIRSNLRKLMRSEPSRTVEIQTNSESFNCRTLLDAYKKNAQCHFKPKNY